MRILAACAVLVLSSAMAVRAEDAPKEEKLDTPEKCMEAYKAAALKADAKGVWRCLSAATRKALSERAAEELKEILASDEAKEEAAKEMGVEVEALAKMTAEEFIVAKIGATMKEQKEEIEKTKFTILKKEDERAIAEVDEGKDHNEKLVLVKKDGEWGIDMEETQKLGHDHEDEGEEEGEGSK
ncbi:MAG: hypothetical protein IT452_16975 [Planctomycetia bacterium]|nr:hypothetical protein [Planctomycetia bacterium]